MRRKRLFDNSAVLSQQLSLCLVEQTNDRNPNIGRPQTIFIEAYRDAIKRTANIVASLKRNDYKPLQLKNPLFINVATPSLPASFSTTYEDGRKIIFDLLSDRLALALAPIPDALISEPIKIEVGQLTYFAAQTIWYFPLGLYYPDSGQKSLDNSKCVVE